MPDLDLTKPIQTRDGRAVHDLHEIERSYLTNLKSLLGGSVDGKYHIWYPWGAWHHEHDHPLDLVNIEEKQP